MTPTLTFLLLAVAAIATLVVVLKMAEPTIPTPQDAQLLLQDTTTKTANFNSAGLDLGSGFAPGGPGLRVSGIVNVTAADRANSDETYSFVLEQSDDNTTFAAAGVAAAVPVAG